MLAVEQFRDAYLAAYRAGLEDVPFPTSSVICAASSHQEDYPGPAVTRYLDHALERQGQTIGHSRVKRRDVEAALRQVRCQPQHAVAYAIVARYDLAPDRESMSAVAARLKMHKSRAYELRDAFWTAVYELCRGRVA